MSLPPKNYNSSSHHGTSNNTNNASATHAAAATSQNDEKKRLLLEQKRHQIEESYYQNQPSPTKLSAEEVFNELEEEQEEELREKTWKEIFCCGVAFPLLVHFFILTGQLSMIICMILIGRFTPQPNQSYLTIILYIVVGAVFSFLMVICASAANTLSEHFNYNIDKLLAAATLVSVISGLGIGILLGNAYGDLARIRIKSHIHVHDTTKYFDAGHNAFEYLGGQLLADYVGVAHQQPPSHLLQLNFDEKSGAAAIDENYYYVVPLVSSNFDASKDLVSVWYAIAKPTLEDNATEIFGAYSHGGIALPPEEIRPYKEALQDAIRKFDGQIRASSNAVLLRNVLPSASLSATQMKLIIGYILMALALVIAVLCHAAAVVRDIRIAHFTYLGEDVPEYLLQL